jgi:hypothetical protein
MFDIYKKQQGQGKAVVGQEERVRTKSLLYDVPITLSKLRTVPSFQISSLPQCQCWARIADLWLGTLFQLSRTNGFMNQKRKTCLLVNSDLDHGVGDRVERIWNGCEVP